MKTIQAKGQLAVICTAILWSTSGLFIKLLEWHPAVIAGTRSFIAACFLLIIRLIFPPLKDVKNAPFPFWSAAVCYSLTMLTFVYANKITTAANAILLQYSAPVWAALLGRYLVKEKPRLEQWGALVLVFAGLLVFLQGGLGSGVLIGDGLGLISGILFAANSVFLRMMKDGNPGDAMLMSHIITAIVCIPFLFIHPPEFSASSVLSILFMGTLQIGLGSLLFSFAMKRISALKAMLTATIEPICNPIWVFLVIGEKPAVSAFIGGGIIITAIVVSSLVKIRHVKPECS